MFTFITQVLEQSPQSQTSSYGFMQARKTYLTKTWHSLQRTTEAYWATYFDVTEIAEPRTMRELLSLVEKYAKDDQTCMLQHTVKEGSSLKNLRRTSENFSVVPLNRFMVFDVDSFPRPEHIDQLDIRAQADYIIELLNSRFGKWFDDDMRYIAKGSSSAGIKDEIRIHLYLENTVPLNTRQLETIASQVNQVFQEEFGVEMFDESLYHAAHVLYTSDPRFEGTMIDPFEDGNRIVSKLKGFTASIPSNTEEKVRAKTVELTEEDLENLKNYNSSLLPSEASSAITMLLEDIRENPDLVYTKKAPRLLFLAIEEGLDLETLKDSFSLAMADHPKIVSGERSIDEYFIEAQKYALGVIKGRALRAMPESIDLATTPKEEIPPEIRDQVMTKLPVDMLYPDGAGTDEGYLNIPNMPPANKLTFWKASLGTGKTTAMQRLLDGDYESGIYSKFKGRMLAITNTVSLVDGNAAKLGAPTNKAYLDKEKRDAFSMNPEGRMSTTIHSLHRFTQMAQDGKIDFVFIDECDAVMDTLINGPANILRERRKCIEALRLLLSTAKYVVLADGDISEETIFSYFALCPKEVAAVDYKFSKLKGSTAYEVRSEESVWVNGVHSSLNESQKVLVVTDLGPKSINERVRALELLHPGLTIKGVHSESTKDQDVRDILENTNDALYQYSVDCLICSPSVVSGVDFHYFDVVAMVTTTKIATPNLRFQALRRCRKPNKEYWIYTDPDTSNFTTGYFNSEYQENRMPSDYIPEKLAVRKNREYSGFKSNLRFMLMDQGCEVVIDSVFDAMKGETLESLAEDMTGISAKGEVREQLIDAILTAREDFVPKRFNNAWEVKKQIAHYYELEHPDNVIYEDVDSYIDEDIHKRMSALADVVRGDLWSAIFYSVKDLETFSRFLRSHAPQWYTATGENAFTGYGRKMNLRNAKYQSSRIGLKLYESDKKIEPNWLQVKAWARKYYEYIEEQIPRPFLTPEEIKKLDETSSDLSLKQDQLEIVSEDTGSKGWFNITGFDV